MMLPQHPGNVTVETHSGEAQAYERAEIRDDGWVVAHNPVPGEANDPNGIDLETSQKRHDWFRADDIARICAFEEETLEEYGGDGDGTPESSVDGDMTTENRILAILSKGVSWGTEEPLSACGIVAHEDYPDVRGSRRKCAEVQHVFGKMRLLEEEGMLAFSGDSGEADIDTRAMLTRSAEVAYSEGELL